MYSDLQIEDYENGLPDCPDTPEEFENDEPDIQTCSCCNSPVVDFIEKHFYIICNECIEEHPGKTLNEIVEMIKRRNQKLKTN